ncbi:hypothetical protein CI109_100352 [Kwoniella shandongensis]|uniref:non-specific serine/threonine protein kinase n=1 Tax=Kwoniella shandongensis TaxID=1734106 RepID=A0AAJ8LBF8_9TREE
MGAACCKPEAIDFDGEVNLFHFYLLRSVGKGAFGKTLFALKYINKAKCVKMKAVANIVQERRLLEEVIHLDRAGAMSEEVVRFYIAEIAMAVDYLHSKRIVHRTEIIDGRGGEYGLHGYELMFGRRPFRGRTNSALTNSILNEPLSWPEDAPGKCSSDGMHAIRGSKRANFDATHELEELLLEENPLKARKRKEGQDLEMMSPEMRMMEEQRSYYHPAGSNNQTTSTATTATATSSHLSPKPMSRPNTPSDRTGLVSRSGMDVEGQILDGGGMANVGGRGGWRVSELTERGSLDLRSRNQPTPLRQASTEPEAIEQMTERPAGHAV